MQKLKNNEARPKFTGSYKKKAWGYFGVKWIAMTVGNPRKLP